MNTIRFHGKINSRPAPRSPGDTRRVLTAPKADATGRVHPKGTKFVPQAGGFDNDARDTYADVVVVS